MAAYVTKTDTMKLMKTFLVVNDGDGNSFMRGYGSTMLQTALISKKMSLNF